MVTRLLSRPIASVLLCTTLCFATAAFAQDTNTKKPMAMGAGGQDEYPDLWEIDPFGGVQTFGQVNRGLDTKLSTGGVGGIRLTANPYKYLGLELWADYSIANMTFGLSNGPIPPGLNGAGSPVAPYGFGARNWTFGFNPVWNLRPRGSRFQPYITAGVDGIQFTPTTHAINLANQPVNVSEYHAQALNDNLQVGANYGGGVKWHFTDHFGARFDVRGLWSRNPTYDLPGAFNGGGVFIPNKSHLNGLQATFGLVIFGGQSTCPEMPPAPPAPAPLTTPTITGADGSASGSFCPGKPVTLHAGMSAGDRRLAYAWTVNGQAQSSTSGDLTFTPAAAGASNVQLTVTDSTPPPPPMERPRKFPVRCWIQPAMPAPVAPVTASATVTVSESAPSITSVSASPTTLTACGDGAKSANLSGVAQASGCGGNLTYKWTVSEGSVTNDTSPNAMFDASSLNIVAGAEAQSKSVTATLQVTDESGKSASQSTTITVSCNPQWVRLDDVIFAKNNSRVNNCGKRLLIDDAASRMANGDYDIILIGHRDTDENQRAGAVRGKGHRGASAAGLDEQRVLNAAAILSGGTGTCGKVDVSRIKMDIVGTDQTSDPRPGQCGTSNTQERKGSQTSEADKNRRVELYLVPHSSTSLPPAVKNARPVPEAAVKALSCPH